MRVAILTVAALVASATSACAQSTASGQTAYPTAAFPGDLGRHFDGLPLPDNPNDRRPPWPSMPAPARAPSAAVAQQIVAGAIAACKANTIGISIIDSSGLPKLYFITDGASGFHAYTGFRKAFTALTFKMPTSQAAELTRTDKVMAARITQDTNLLAFGGGLPIISHGEIIGAVGVSGIEPAPGDTSNPSLKDERCAKAGLDSAQALLN